MASKTHQSAIIVMPPSDSLLYESIQAIRKTHDKQFHRWMPHINMAYPFYDRSEFDRVAAELTPALSAMAPFPVSLARFNCFVHGNSGATVWLDPQESGASLVRLQAVLAATFPDCTDLQHKGGGGFQPHLTVAQCDSANSAQALIRQLTERWRPHGADFLVRSVELISREGPDDPFIVRHSLPLGGGELA